MPVTVYKSTDASAPVLNGLAGTICTVLDAILVNGYGAKASAGWAIAFTGTNKRIYRPPTGQLRGFYRVQDDAPRAAPFADAREFRLKGSEAASAVDTQTGLYPTAAQFVNGLFIRKSVTADATARAWICVADARTCYFFCQSGDYGNGWASFMMGEYFSIKPTADLFNGLVIGRTLEQVAATPLALATDEPLPKLVTLTTTAVGHFIARSFSETSQSAVNVGKHGQGGHSGVGLVGLFLYPNPYDAGIYLAPVWVHEPATIMIARGRMRGFWHLLHPPSALNDGDTWSGSGALAGKTFLAIKPVPDGLGTFVMETSDTWETN